MSLSLPAVVRRVVAAEPLLVCAIAPALLFPTFRRLAVLALVPLLWSCAWAAGERIVPRTPMNSALAVLMAMVGVSLFATFDVSFSLGKVSGVILGVLLFLAIARWLTTEDRLKVAAVGFVFAGVGLAVVGLLGTAWEGKFATLRAFSEMFPKAIRGLPGAEEGFSPNAVAGCLVLFIPMQFALFAADAHRWLVDADERNRTRNLAAMFILIIEALLLFITAGTLVLTQSRSAWSGLFAAAASGVVWYSRRTRMAAVAVLAALLLIASIPGGNNPVNAVVNRVAGDAKIRIHDRAGIWMMALYGIRDFPLTGMGMNAFRKVGPLKYKAAYPLLITSPGDTTVPHAHNHLLQAALDLGIPGLIAYLALWCLAGTLLTQVYRRSGRKIYRAMAGGLGAGLIAHFVFSMTDAIPLGAKVGVLFWLTLAITVALHRVSGVSRQSSHSLATL